MLRELHSSCPKCEEEGREGQITWVRGTRPVKRENFFGGRSHVSVGRQRAAYRCNNGHRWTE
jgi:hypothetical protein